MYALFYVIMSYYNEVINLAEENIVSLPLIAVRAMVIFPSMVTSIPLGRDKSLSAVKAASSEYNNTVILASQKNVMEAEVDTDGIYTVGTLAKIKQTLMLPGNTTHIIVEGITRVKLSEIKGDGKYFVGVGEKIPQDTEVQYDEVTESYMRVVGDAFGEYNKLSDSKLNTQEHIMAVTNLTIASRTVVVAGYGWCGKGVAMRAKGMGARVIVTEVDPVKAIEAVMDGFEVMPMLQAAAQGDLFITVTGCKDVITAEHIQRMKDGAILSNAGHFDCEVNKRDLAALASEIYERKPSITGYRMPDGRIINLLAEGRLVNLAAGMGHPAEIMDMSFAIQAQALAYLVQHHSQLANKLYPVPKDIDAEIARLKLASLQVQIDKLTEEQEKYLHSSCC